MNTSIWRRATDALGLRYRRCMIGTYGAGLGGGDDESESGPWIPAQRRDRVPASEARPATSDRG